MIRESLINAAHPGGVSASKVPWYFNESVWTFIVEALEFISDLFRATNKPLISLAIDTVVSAANSSTNYANKHELLFRKKLHVLSQELAKVERETVAYFRIDAQLELLAELMENGCANG